MTTAMEHRRPPREKLTFAVDTLRFGALTPLWAARDFIREPQERRDLLKATLAITALSTAIGFVGVSAAAILTSQPGQPLNTGAMAIGGIGGSAILPLKYMLITGLSCARMRRNARRIRFAKGEPLTDPRQHPLFIGEKTL